MTDEARTYAFAFLLWAVPVAIVVGVLVLSIVGLMIYYLRFLWLPLVRLLFMLVTWFIFITAWVYAITGVLYACGFPGPIAWVWSMYIAMGRLIF